MPGASTTSPSTPRNIWYDAKYEAGRVDRRTYLSRYGGQRDADKYSALDSLDLGTTLAACARPDETVFIFGFSPAAYVYADRRSASRFFWSRPVILDFHATDPRWGVDGLARDLDRSRPACVALQRHDWAPDVEDSEPFFLSHPPLADWLRAQLSPGPGTRRLRRLGAQRPMTPGAFRGPAGVDPR